MANKAVFLDRDHTLIDEPSYLTDPSAVRLLPAVETALRILREAGYKLIVVTNQSAIARGLLTVEGLQAVHDEMSRQLEERGARLDAIYYCPFHPEGTVEAYARESEDRKPRPGMLLRAAKEHDLDLTASWMVGDSPRDIEAGQRAGCRSIRVRLSREEAAKEDEDVQADFVVRNLLEAAHTILREAGQPVPVPAVESAQAPPAGQHAEHTTLLAEILSHIRQMNLSRHGDFSVTRLVAWILQIFAFAALAVAVVYLLDVGVKPVGDGARPELVAHLALLTCMALQLIAMNFFLISRHR